MPVLIPALIAGGAVTTASMYINGHESGALQTTLGAAETNWSVQPTASTWGVPVTGEWLDLGIGGALVVLGLRTGGSWGTVALIFGIAFIAYALLRDLGVTLKHYDLGGWNI